MKKKKQNIHIQIKSHLGLSVHVASGDSAYLGLRVRVHPCARMVAHMAAVYLSIYISVYMRVCV